MDDDAWAEALSVLARAADELAVLSRCLDVVSQLEAWRLANDTFPGTDAANALDQALGMLEVTNGRCISAGTPLPRR